MKTLKKLVSLLLAAVLSCAGAPILSAGASAAGKITHSVEYENGTAYLTVRPSSNENYLTYTTDGNPPAANSKRFTAFVPVRTETLFRFAEYTQQGKKIGGIKFTVTPKVSNVVFEISKGVGLNTLKLSCDTPDAVIRYTLDGTDPTSKSDIYTTSLTFNKKTQIKAAAFKDGCKRSAISSRTYSILKDIPAADTDKDNSAADTTAPEEDKTSAGTDVKDDVGTGEKIKYTVSYFAENGYTKMILSPRKGTNTIYYTIDGTTPNKGSKKYNDSSIKITSPCTLKAIEFNKAGQRVASLKYNVKLKCAPVELECTALYAGTRTLALKTKTAGAAIYYTLSGETPGEKTGRRYTGPIDVGDDTTIKAVVVKNGYIDSSVKSVKASYITFSDVEYDVDDPDVWELFQAINDERAKRGNEKFEMTDKMLKAANVRLMEASVYTEHMRPNGDGYNSVFEENNIVTGMIAEIFALGYKTPTKFVNDAIANAKSYDDDALLFSNKYRFNSIGIAMYKNGNSRFAVILLADVK